MRAKWLCLTISLLAIGCEPAQVDPEVTLVDETIAEAGLSRRLKIDREALFNSSSDQIRIDAATVMLFSEDPLARRILLDALRQSENLGARVAACKALTRYLGPLRGW
jgi:hypothetical protein